MEIQMQQRDSLLSLVLLPSPFLDWSTTTSPRHSWSGNVQRQKSDQKGCRLPRLPFGNKRVAALRMGAFPPTTHAERPLGMAGTSIHNRCRPGGVPSPFLKALRPQVRPFRARNSQKRARARLKRAGGRNSWASATPSLTQARAPPRRPLWGQRPRTLPPARRVADGLTGGRAR
jgi:hypothetical protein